MGLGRGLRESARGRQGGCVPGGGAIAPEGRGLGGPGPGAGPGACAVQRGVGRETPPGGAGGGGEPGGGGEGGVLSGRPERGPGGRREGGGRAGLCLGGVGSSRRSAERLRGGAACLPRTAPQRVRAWPSRRGARAGQPRGAAAHGERERAGTGVCGREGLCPDLGPPEAVPAAGFSGAGRKGSARAARAPPTRRTKWGPAAGGCWAAPAPLFLRSGARAPGPAPRRARASWGEGLRRLPAAQRLLSAPAPRGPRGSPSPSRSPRRVEAVWTRYCSPLRSGARSLVDKSATCFVCAPVDYVPRRILGVG